MFEEGCGLRTICDKAMCHVHSVPVVGLCVFGEYVCVFKLKVTFD